MDDAYSKDSPAWREEQSPSPIHKPREGMKLSELRSDIQNSECPGCEIRGTAEEVRDGTKITFYCPSCLHKLHEHEEIDGFDHRERVADRDDSNRARNISTHQDIPMFKLDRRQKEGDIVCLMRKNPERSLITSEKKLLNLKKNKSQTGTGGWNHQTIPEWKSKSDAKRQLERGGDLVRERLHRVFPEIEWESKLSNVMESSLLNKRSLHTEGGVKYTAHKDTSWGLESYVRLTCENRSFWFFEEFLDMYHVHLENADRHLREGHPFNTFLILGNLNERHNSIMKKSHDSPKIIDSGQVKFLFDALSRHLKFESWKNLPDHFEGDVEDKIWHKLELRGRGDTDVSGPRFWVPYKDREIIQHNGVEYISGGLRKQGTFSLSHIPVAYVVAQMVYDEGNSRGVDGNRLAREILHMISRDLEWCEADRETMDDWWERIITDRRGDREWSVTRL